MADWQQSKGQLSNHATRTTFDTRQISLSVRLDPGSTPNMLMTLLRYQIGIDIKGKYHGKLACFEKALLKASK